MYMLCRHIKANGLRCESPALKDAHFCYYHSKLHAVGEEPHLRFGPLQLPAPEDSAAIQLSVARISDAVIRGIIDLKKAAALFNGLRIASRFVPRFSPPNPERLVQSAEQIATGEELAPGSYACSDDDDCGSCPSASQCARSNVS